MISQYEIHIVDLNPTIGAEMRKTRPAVVLSPDESNRHLSTVIVAPVTSKLHGYRFRVKFSTPNCAGEIALDHIRSVDKARLVRRVDKLDALAIRALKAALREYLVD